MTTRGRSLRRQSATLRRFSKVFWTLPSSFLTGASAAAGLAVINSVGNLGGFAAQNLVPLIHDRTGSNQAPMLFLAACVLVAGVTIFAVLAFLEGWRGRAGVVPADTSSENCSAIAVGACVVPEDGFAVEGGFF